MEAGRLKVKNLAVDRAMAYDSLRSPTLPPCSPHLMSTQMTPPQATSPQIPSPQMIPPPIHSPIHSYYQPKLADHPAYRDQGDNEFSEHPTAGPPAYQDQGHNRHYANDLAKNPHSQARQSQIGPLPLRQVAAELPGSEYPNPSPYLNPGAQGAYPDTPSHRTFPPSPNMATNSSDRSSVISELPNNYQGLPSPGLGGNRVSMVSELATPPMPSTAFESR